MDRDDNIYFTTFSMSNNSSITAELNIPEGVELNNYYFKITQALTKNTADGLVHLHSRFLSSDKSYNNITYTGDVIGSYPCSTSTQLFNFDLSADSLALPIPSFIGNNNNVDFYLTDSEYASSNITNFEFQVGVFEKQKIAKL